MKCLPSKALLPLLTVALLAPLGSLRAGDDEDHRDIARDLVLINYVASSNTRVLTSLRVRAGLTAAYAAASLESPESSMGRLQRRVLEQNSEAMKRIVLNESTDVGEREVALSAIVVAGPYVPTRIGAAESARVADATLRRKINEGMRAIDTQVENLRAASRLR